MIIQFRILLAKLASPWCHELFHMRQDIQHNDIQHNDTQRYDTQHNDTQHNDIQRRNT